MVRNAIMVTYPDGMVRKAMITFPDRGNGKNYYNLP